MSNIKSLLLGALAAVSPAITGAATVPVFDANANTNLAVYWGQGPNQQRLAHFCADTNIDIIPIGFVNQFPDQTGGYPGTNFGNQCGATYYKNTDGSASKLLSSCPDIGPDIKTCQAMGKKILLSLGGAIPNNQHIASSASATSFATFLWRAFGPDREASGSTFPRPFGDAAVDGFDFDIENVLASKENSQDLYYGYSTMISSLRGFYAKEPKPYYISGAPQCLVPDAHLANAIQYSHFDFLFVQFYNTAQCSARAYFDHTYGAYGGPATNISFDAWVTFVQKYSNNKSVKVFLGLPASNSNQIVTDSKMYLQPAEAQKIIDTFQCKYPTVFGGVMLYEATASETNSINGKPYADVLKGYLTSNKCAAKWTASGVDSLPPAASTAPKELRAREAASCSKASCFSTLTNTADVPDPTEFCQFNDLLGGIPFPNGEGLDCNSVSISSACSCLTAAPTSSSSSSSSARPTSKTSSSTRSTSKASSSRTSSKTSSSATSTSKASSSSSYTRPSGSPSVSSNSTSHTASSGTAPYSKSSGTAPYSRSTGTAPYSKSSGTAPYSSSSGTAPYSKSSGTAPPRSGTAPLSSATAPISTESGTAPFSSPSGTGSLVPSGSSKVPYPLTNSSAPATSNEAPPTTVSSGTSPTGGSGFSRPSASGTDIVTTETISSFTTVCPFTSTVTSGGSQIVTTGLTTSTVFSTKVITICTRCTAKPTPTPTDILTTETVTSYTTVCPFTSTISSGGSQSVTTGLTTSTVFSTKVITVCTKCTAKPIPTPLKSGENSPSVPSSNGASPASTQEVVTTVIVYTTATTCPVTQTLTSGGVTITKSTETVSTVTSTTTSTICTKCVPPSSKVPAFPSQTPVQTALVGGNGANSPQQPASSPSNARSSTPGKSNSPALGQNSPAQGSNSPASSAAAGPSTSPGQAGSNANSPAQGNNSPTNTPGASPSTTPEQGGSNANSPAAGSSAPANAPTNGPASAGGSSGSALPKIETLTIVPEAVTATQTNHFAQATGSQSGVSAPYPAGNGTSPAGPSGSAVTSSSASSSSPTGPSPFQSSTVAFKGAANRLSGGVGLTIVVALVAHFIL